ncbi:hypothetical protein [Paenibacillus sp. KR2-11]|uniref:hypothetical protein n=1 Tax=Paenibacillus sp. KR2-11 TaxID=3385500 RepID=UPI0038FD2310
MSLSDEVLVYFERAQRIVTKELFGPEDVEVKIRGGVMMSDDKKYLLSPQKDGTYVRVLEDGRKEILTHQQVLEMIYEMDPLIKKTAEKLDRLSQDPEVIRQHEGRKELLKQQRSIGSQESDKV